MIAGLQNPSYREEGRASQLLVYESAAKSLAASVFKLMNPMPLDYALCNVAEFGHLDLDSYQSATSKLLGCGLKQIMDVESLEHARSTGKRILLRIMFAPDESFAVAIFNIQAKPPGRFKRWLGILLGQKFTPQPCIIEIETEFANGEFVVTNNAQGMNPFSQPPEMHRLEMPWDTTPAKLLAEHQRHVTQYQCEHAGVGITRVSSLRDLNDRNLRENRLKAAHRRAIGGISREEIKNLTKEKFPYMEESVMKEMRRLMLVT